MGKGKRATEREKKWRKFLFSMAVTPAIALNFKHKTLSGTPPHNKFIAFFSVYILNEMAWILQYGKLTGRGREARDGLVRAEPPYE